MFTVRTKEALKIGLKDIAFGESMQEFCDLLQSFRESAAESPNFHRNIRAKKEDLARNNLAKFFNTYREEELERMWTNFYGPDQSYHFREGAPRS